MLNFEHVGVRILVGIVVIILAFVLLKYFTSDSECSITEYAAPVPKRPQGILKSPKKLIQKLQQLPLAKKPAEWAPSPIDDTISPYGDFSNNRFPSSFVTNVASGFPENDEGISAARKKLPATQIRPRGVASDRASRSASAGAVATCGEGRPARRQASTNCGTVAARGLVA